MLTAEESAELRTLHARAYGRDANLSLEDGARLRELETQRRGVPGPSAGSGSGQTGESVAETVEVSDGSDDSGIGVDKPVAEPDPRSPEAPGPPERRLEGAGGIEAYDRSSWHPRLRWLIAGAAAAIAIGVGIGWSIWGQSHDAIALTDEQRGWQVELAADDEYDPGSFVALREENEVVVWTATQGDGEKTCLLMSNGTESSTACQRTEGIRAEGLWLDLQVPTSQEGTFDVTNANLLFRADGHPAVVTDRYRNFYDTGPVYEPEDQKSADLLIGLGYQQSALWIVGYFEDRPVWTGAYAGAADEQCLVYVAPSGVLEEDCGTWEDNLDDPLTLTIGSDDAGMRTAEIVYASTKNGPHYLAITIQPVSHVSVDTETGDPIEFTVDDPTFDDLVVDDKTGEFGE